MKLKYIIILFVFLLIGCSSPEEKAEKYTKSGYQLLDQGEYKKAALQFKNALQLDKEKVKAWYGLSLAEEKQGNLNNVYVLLNKVVELQPSHLQAHIKLGKIMLAGQLIDKALNESAKAMQLAPENADVRALRAAVLLQLTDNEGAIREANIALQQDENNVDALIVLASEKLSNGDARAAIKYLDRGIAINEKNLVLHLIKIKAFDSISEEEEVIKVFRRLISIYPDDKVFRLALAKYYISVKDIDNAEKIYTNAIIYDPRDLELKLEFSRFVFKEKGFSDAVSLLSKYIKDNDDEVQLKFALAELYSINKKYDEAKNIYKRITASKPRSQESFLAKTKHAEILFKQSYVDKSRNLINELLELDPKRIDALLLLVSIELYEGNVDKAISDLRTALNYKPDSAKALVLLARAHSKNNASALAKSNYSLAVQKQPSNQAVVLEYVNYLVNTKELNLAEDVLQTFLDGNPGSIQGLQTMAQLKLKKGDWESANGIVKKIQKFGGDEIITEQLLGAVYLGQENYIKSIEAFKRAHRASPSSAQPIVALVGSYVRAGKEKEARYFIKSVLDAHPSNIYALILMGQRHVLDNEFKQAEYYFKKAIKTNVDNPLGYLELAKLYSSKKRYNDAIMVIDAGIKGLPDNILLQLSKARVLEFKSEFDKAIALYSQILSDNPSVELAANNLSSLIADHRSHDIKSLEYALKLSLAFKDSINPYFRDTLGWVYYKLGQPEQSKHLFEYAIENVPHLPVFHYHLGMSLLALGKKEEAKLSLEKALSLAGNNLTGMEDINEILQTL